MDNKSNDLFEKEDTKEPNLEKNRLSKPEFVRLNNKIDIQFDKLNQNIINTSILIYWVTIILGLVSVGLIVYIFTLLSVK